MSKEQIKCLLTLANSGDLANLKVMLEDCLSISQTARVHDIVHQKSGDGLLHILARCGHTDCLKFLLTQTEVFVDQRNLEDKTALHEAAQYGQDTTIEILLQRGAQVNSLKRADWTPLMLATTKQNNLACVKILDTSGADLRLVNKDGWTSFHIAVRTGDLSLLECWQTASKNCRTPLHTACLTGHLQVVNLLLQLNTTGVLDVNCPDSCGSTPLMDAMNLS
jgi:ankyrin repeat protein